MTTLLYDIILLNQRGPLLSAKVIAKIEKRFDHLVQKGRERKRRRLGHNLVLRFYYRRDTTLRYLHNPLFPTTNNLAERDLPPLKLKQKISGSFQTEAGAQDFAVRRSVLDAVRKRKVKALDISGINPGELIVYGLLPRPLLLMLKIPALYKILVQPMRLN